MGLFQWLRGESGGPRDVLKNEPVGRAHAEDTPAEPGAEPGAGPSATAREEIAELINRRRKIQAIKRLREETGCGLAEAKHAVERGTWTGML